MYFEGSQYRRSDLIVLKPDYRVTVIKYVDEYCLKRLGQRLGVEVAGTNESAAEMRFGWSSDDEREAKP